MSFVVFEQKKNDTNFFLFFQIKTDLIDLIVITRMLLVVRELLVKMDQIRQ